MTEVMAAEIEKLIERLEKLTGSDARVDDAIQAHCVPRSERTIQAPRFTKSIDAALTLVRPGTQIEMIWGAENHKAYVELIPPPAGVADGVAANPAIALCIASLKAIAALRALSHKGSSNG